ncbi:MAG TPA: alpha/beta fold hydrolase [Acidimicrobiales bacterium]|nr:alpha/beta fold hydrolase [Acidimicrobiales bacterium]
METRLVEVTDQRVVEVAQWGAAGGPVVVFHSGTPTGLVPFDPLLRSASERGVRVVTVLRPGYGRSTPSPGRTVADVAADIGAVASSLAIDSYVAIGHSGGGPHALACRELDAPRCRAAITVAGVGPYGAEGLDFLDGMGEDNVEEFGAALAGEPALTDFLSAFAGAIFDIQPDGVIEAIGSLLPEVDRRYLLDGLADYLAAALRTGVANGIDGWRDDDLAFVRRWGFETARLTNVSIWQGIDDLMVPFAHGRYLAGVIPGSTPHLLEGEGHLSVLAGQIDAIVDEALAYLR